jgi:hypothetical protein
MASVSQALKTVKSAVQKAVQATSAAAQRAVNGIGSVIQATGQVIAKTASNVTAAVITGAKSTGMAVAKAASGVYNTVASVVKSTGGAITGYVAGVLTPKSTITVQSTSPSVINTRPTVDYMPSSSGSTQPSAFYSSGSGTQSSAGTGSPSIPNDPLFDQGAGGVSISGEQGVDGGLLGSNSPVGQASNGLLYGLAAGALLLGFSG